MTTYRYDLAGQRRRSHESFAGGYATRDLTWSYDGLYRLTGEAWTGAAAQTRTYAYDPAGNRLARTVAAVGQPAQSTAYAYNALNQLTHSSQTQAGGGPSLFVDYAYDANGNRTSRAASGNLPGQTMGTSTYAYDVGNRLVDAYTPKADGTNAPFHAYYDARSRRIAKAEGNDTTRFRYDGASRVDAKSAHSHPWPSRRHSPYRAGRVAFFPPSRLSCERSPVVNKGSAYCREGDLTPSLMQRRVEAWLTARDATVNAPLAAAVERCVTRR